MRLRATLLLSLVAALSPIARPSLAADERQAVNAKADRFQAEIKKLGGYVHRDKQRPGSPVVAVDLRGPQVSDATLEMLASQKDLETLVLVGAKVTDTGLKHLAKLGKLESLDLVGNEIDDTGLVALKNLQHLQTLVLNTPRVTDEGLKPLAGLSSLEALHLHGTQVTGSGLKSAHFPRQTRSGRSAQRASTTTGWLPWRNCPRSGRWCWKEITSATPGWHTSSPSPSSSTSCWAAGKSPIKVWLLSLA